MNLIKCANGHYYNADKLSSCPHCISKTIKIPVDDPTGKNQSDIGTFIPDTASREAYIQATCKRLTGWLVCIQGNMEGDSFTLFSGDNHIGRDTGMDVCLFNEPTVSRCNHAVITYDSIYAHFTLHTDSATVLHNDRPLPSGQSVLLKTHDKITLGDCVLVFVPFCGKYFQWDEDNYTS